MARPPRLKKAIASRRRRPSQQFGQTDDEFTINGSLGCTQTILQWLAWFWLKTWYTHDQISRIAGYPDMRSMSYNSRRGMTPTEVQNFCDRVGLPYKVRFGVTAEEVMRFSKRGPVGFAHSYSYVPEWKGYRYGNRVADGRPNGFASPREKAGRTQLSGFVPPYDAHFGILFGVNETTNHVFTWEPNHGSASRSEKPPFDRMTKRQFTKVYDSYANVLRRTPYALIPTERFPL